MVDRQILEVVEILAAGQQVDATAFEKMKRVFREFSNGYRYHPLGFYYSAIQIDDLRDLRFHIWPESWSVPVSQDGGELHDHNFGLTSAVLKGELCNENYEVTESDGGKYRVLVVTYDGVGSKIKPSGGRVDIALAERSKQKEGMIYHVPAGTVHQTFPSRLPAATLVLAQKSEDAPPPRVLSENSSLANRSFNRTAICDKDERDVLAIIRSL